MDWKKIGKAAAVAIGTTIAIAVLLELLKRRGIDPVASITNGLEGLMPAGGASGEAV